MDTFISEDEIIELLVDLVRVPSVNPPADTRECSELIQRKFKQEKIDAEIVQGNDRRSNVVAGLRGQNNGKTLLLNGHIDVVAPGENWTVDPFGGEIRNGKIYGRGTCDMKSGVVAMIAAMIGLKRSGVSFGGEIIFQGVADEETGSEWGTVYLLKNNIGKNADFAIVSEPTSLNVATGNRGLRWIDISVQGEAAHAGRPHLGINAVDYAAKLIQSINSMKFEVKNDFFEVPCPSISVTMINGGSKVNIIPERCNISIDRRMIPGETSDSVAAELKQIIDALVKREKGLRVKLDMRPSYWDPYQVSENEPVVQATIGAVEEVMGAKPQILGKAGCTDASHLFHSGGIPTVILGPGNEKLAHKADECIEIKNLVSAVPIFISIFHKLLCCY